MNTFAQKLYVEGNHEFINKVKDHNEIQSFIIWQKLDENLIGLLYRGSFDFPPTIKGRFFMPSDFYCNKHLAVVGKNMLSLVINDKKGSSIDLLGDRYEVIGVIEEKYSSNVDNSIYFNLDSNVSSDIFYIDGKNSTAITRTISDLSKIIDVNKINDPPNGIGRLFGYSNKNFKVKVVCMLICIATIMLSINFFISANYSIIIVQHLIGTSVISIVFRLILKLCACLFIVLFIGTLVSNMILPNIFVQQEGKFLPDVIFLLGAFYLFPQLIGALFLLYIKIGRIFK